MLAFPSKYIIGPIQVHPSLFGPIARPYPLSYSLTLSLAHSYTRTHTHTHAHTHTHTHTHTFSLPPPSLSLTHARTLSLFLSLSLSHTHTHARTHILTTVKEEIFVGEKFRTFPSKTFRMELNFVLSNWPKTEKVKKTIERPANHAEEIFVWKLISYIFGLYESYEIKCPTKISSFTVHAILSIVKSSLMTIFCAVTTQPNQLHRLHSLCIA